jgi:DNA-binding NtrC family response regulator
VPPLRARTDDIPELVRFFIKRHARNLGVETPSIQSEALTFLQSKQWPGNVREIENVVRQALLLARPFGIGVEQLRTALARTGRPVVAAGQTHGDYIAALLARVQRGEEQDAYSRMVADLETELFAQAIRLANGNQAQAARWLGVTRLKMREKLAELGIRPRAIRPEDSHRS